MPCPEKRAGVVLRDEVAFESCSLDDLDDEVEVRGMVPPVRGVRSVARGGTDRGGGGATRRRR
ncbi:MAG: hypothetical protein L0I76_30080 [Pseudonocardia sp.]|nr:hypothetical protein [Pseudonocardia sp.]